MLESESGSNDPFSYMLTVIFVILIKGSAGDVMVINHTDGDFEN